MDTGHDVEPIAKEGTMATRQKIGRRKRCSGDAGTNGATVCDYTGPVRLLGAMCGFCAPRSCNFLLFAGNSNRPLAQRIAEKLGCTLGNAVVGRFPDGEVSVKLNDHVRGADVFVVQSTCPPVNENLMELLVMIDCLRRASARRITAVIPYFGYARQDRKDDSRVPITAKLVANLLATAGVDRVITIDLHSAQIQGFFDIPVDHLYAAGTVILRHVREALPREGVVVVSPDVGSIKLARALSKRLNARLATVDKRRISATETEVGFVIGRVRGMHALIADDMISTAGSITDAVAVVRKKGARDVTLAATHPVLCGPAIGRLKAARVREVIVTDTVPVVHPPSNMAVVTVAGLLAQAMHRVHCNESVSTLFEDEGEGDGATVAKG